MPDDTMTVEEAKLLLDLSKTTVLRLYHSGQLQGYQITSGVTAPIRLYKESIFKFITNVQKRSLPSSLKIERD